MMCFVILTFLTISIHWSDCVQQKDSDLENLKLQVERLSALREEDHKKIQSLENQYISERNERLALDESLADLKSLHKETDGARATRSIHLPVFAFHTVLSSDFVASQDNQPVPFDYVSADYPTGHTHYNSTTGKYTCLLEGFYFFSWSIGATGQGSSAETSLVKNGDWHGMQIAYDSFASSSASVILHLDIQDTVWIKVSTKGSSVLRDVSSFMGYRLSG
ncbi:collagen alpha-1(X) chain-like [Argopecten irradians]|uniref:collagen alpha-1(X) chain-like n=1 Tax=Argopecten irradians TaxID=31199 RepID=UPI003717F5FE